MKIFNKIIIGQIFLILCCIVYLIWWYCSFKPGENVKRISGVNGLLLLITFALGIIGIAYSISSINLVRNHIINTSSLPIIGIISYIILFVITRFFFNRIVTTELFLITFWTIFEIYVADKIYAMGNIGKYRFITECIIIAFAFIISIILYVAYYNMDEWKAFYTAMIPLITEGVAMLSLVLMAVF